MEIKDYSEIELWNPNTGSQYIFDEDDFYSVYEYYNEVWNINKGFKLYYQQYLQERQYHILEIE